MNAVRVPLLRSASVIVLKSWRATVVHPYSPLVSRLSVRPGTYDEPIPGVMFVATCTSITQFVSASL